MRNQGNAREAIGFSGRIGGWLPVVAATLHSVCIIATAQGAPALASPADSSKTESRPSLVSPVSIWVTPAVGLYGRALGGGVTLQMDMNRGWSAGVDVSAAEEFCILCGHLPEKYLAGALLFGYRKADGPAFISIAAGPSWGKGEHRKPGAKPTPDPDCTWLCWDTPPEMIQDRGFGFRFQTDAAVAGRHIGIGAQLHIAYVPDHIYAGVAFIVPMGRLRQPQRAF